MAKLGGPGGRNSSVDRIPWLRQVHRRNQGANPLLRTRVVRIGRMIRRNKLRRPQYPGTTTGRGGYAG